MTLDSILHCCLKNYLHKTFARYVCIIEAPVTPDRAILWSYDWLRFGQLRQIGNVCCDLLLQSHALVYSLRLVVGHVNLHDNLLFIPSGQL